LFPLALLSATYIAYEKQKVLFTPSIVYMGALSFVQLLCVHSYGVINGMSNKGKPLPKPSDFFGRKKNPQHAFLRRESKAFCHMSQI
jgi:hypothetical protein